MALAAIIKEEAYKVLSDPIKAEYKKQDNGTYLLDVTPIDDFALENVKGLKSALASERTQREAAEAKVRGFADLDPAKAREALRKIEEMATWTPEQKVKEQIEAIKTQLTEKHKTEFDKTQQQLLRRNAILQKVMIDGEAIKAIIEQGALKDSADILLYPVREATRMRETESGDFVVEVVGADGNVRLSPATGSTAPMTISELIAEMKAKDKYAPLFAGTGATGSGAAGTGSQGRRSNAAVLAELAKLPPAERLKKARELGIKS